MNIKNKAIELRTSRFTSDPGALQKGEDFARALTYGFDVDDAICLIRLDGLYD
jgi:RNA-binding protein PNO1